MTIIEQALAEKVDEGKTISLPNVLRIYARETYIKLYEAKGKNDRVTTALIQAMIDGGIITSTGDWKHLKREFVDKTLGISSGNTVRIYESQVKRFLTLIGIDTTEKVNK